VGLRWNAGTLTSATIASANGNACRVRAAVPLAVTSQGRAVKVTRPEPGVIEFPTAKGASYLLTVGS
jgi:alpha-L-fucosidase 2